MNFYALIIKHIISQILTWFNENKTGLQKFFNKEMSNELTKNSYFGTSGVRLVFKLVVIDSSLDYLNSVIAPSSPYHLENHYERSRISKEASSGTILGFGRM